MMKFQCTFTKSRAVVSTTTEKKKTCRRDRIIHIAKKCFGGSEPSNSDTVESLRKELDDAYSQLQTTKEEKAAKETQASRSFEVMYQQYVKSQATNEKLRQEKNCILLKNRHVKNDLCAEIEVLQGQRHNLKRYAKSWRKRCGFAEADLVRIQGQVEMLTTSLVESTANGEEGRKLLQEQIMKCLSYQRRVDELTKVAQHNEVQKEREALNSELIGRDMQIQNLSASLRARDSVIQDLQYQLALTTPLPSDADADFESLSTTESTAVESNRLSFSSLDEFADAWEIESASIFSVNVEDSNPEQAYFDARSSGEATEDMIRQVNASYEALYDFCLEELGPRLGPFFYDHIADRAHMIYPSWCLWIRNNIMSHVFRRQDSPIDQ
ncbi:hypothetical protein FRC03_000527 [Tulasnella sp. 419]|nr:hypothetical protein FRC03_000527 [Tulasnella sp. 419]